MAFVCSICEEESTRICVRCTKDTCSNHLCEKCGACSDCCDCEIHLDEEPHHEAERVHPSSDNTAGSPVFNHGPGAIQVTDEMVRPPAEEE